jgi:glycosyltransferase involved in cell wall biosynthesis/GT2 family glycosyltransferase
MPEGADVHVVVVAYGDPGALHDCLAALEDRFPVTVVDNSSSPETRAVAKRTGARYLDPGANVGFAAGVNVALRTLDLEGTDVLLLNPDATVEPAVVDDLHRRLGAHPDVACVAPAQRAPDGEKPAPVCWPFATPGGAWLEAVGLGRFRRRWGYVIGSVLMVRGRALLDVGLFDESYFLYAEESDWQRRATLRGWRVDFASELAALHVGAATDHDPGRRRLRFHAAVELYLRTWHGSSGWQSYRVATVLTALRRALVHRRERRSGDLALARLYASGPRRLALRAEVVPPGSVKRARGPSPGAGTDGPHAAPRRALLVESIGYAALGGAAMVTNEIIQGVDRARYVPVLVCLSKGKWPDAVRASGTQAYALPRARLRSPINLVRVVVGLRTIIRREGIDVVHVSENSALFYGALAARLARRPAVWHIHSPLFPRSREERLTARLLQRLRPQAIVFTSAGARAKTIEFPGVPTHVVLPGVDLERCRQGDARRGREAFDIPDDAVLLSMFARVDRAKGGADFVECLGKLAPGHPKLVGIMCGPGDPTSEYWKELEAMAEERGLGARFLMPGDVRPPVKDDVVAASAVVVHPSRAEAFGLAVLEAMAAGKPVVAADTDGPRLLIDDGVDGLLVPVKDVAALTEAVEGLLDDPGRAAAIGARAAAAAERFPVTAMVARVEALWDEVLGASPLRSHP